MRFYSAWVFLCLLGWKGGCRFVFIKIAGGMVFSVYYASVGPAFFCTCALVMVVLYGQNAASVGPVSFLTAGQKYRNICASGKSG